MVSLLLVLSACGGTPAESGAEAPSSTTETAESETAASTVFNKESLATYDGQNGNRAYVAVNGVVYDVTDVPNWRGGKHQGNTAGMDLTSVLGRSPHGEKVLKDLPVVGTYE